MNDIRVFVDDGPMETVADRVKFYGYTDDEIVEFTVSAALAERIENAVILTGEANVRVPADAVVSREPREPQDDPFDDPDFAAWYARLASEQS
jgi:hypothetical protein